MPPGRWHTWQFCWMIVATSAAKVTCRSAMASVCAPASMLNSPTSPKATVPARSPRWSNLPTRWSVMVNSLSLWQPLDRDGEPRKATDVETHGGTTFRPSLYCMQKSLAVKTFLFDTTGLRMQLGYRTVIGHLAAELAVNGSESQLHR